MKRIHSQRLGMFLACALVFFVAGCGEQQAEQAGKAIDEAIEKTTDSVNEAVENTGKAVSDTLESAADGIKDATDSTGTAINDAATDAGDKVTEATGTKE